VEKSASNHLGFIFGLLSGLSFGVMGFLVHISSGQTPSSELVFIRAIFTCLVLLPFVFHYIRRLLSKETIFLWLRCIAGSISMLCLYWTLQHSNVGMASTFSHMSPIFVVFLSWKFFNEKILLKETMAIAIAICGVAVLCSQREVSLSLSVLLVGTMGAISAGVAHVSLKQAAVKFSPMLVVWAFSLVMLITSFAVPSPNWTIPTMQTFLPIVGVSVSGLLGQIFLTQSYMHLKAPVASTFGLSALIWGVVCESLYYRDMPTLGESISYSLVILGVALLQVLHRSSSAATKHEEEPLDLSI
jgi:drug/metabolite transporter (DMT)-like permease